MCMNYLVITSELLMKTTYFMKNGTFMTQVIVGLEQLTYIIMKWFFLNTSIFYIPSNTKNCLLCHLSK